MPTGLYNKGQTISCNCLPSENNDSKMLYRGWGVYVFEGEGVGGLQQHLLQTSQGRLNHSSSKKSCSQSHRRQMGRVDGEVFPVSLRSQESDVTHWTIRRKKAWAVCDLLRVKGWEGVYWFQSVYLYLDSNGTHRLHEQHFYLSKATQETRKAWCKHGCTSIHQSICTVQGWTKAANKCVNVRKLTKN